MKAFVLATILWTAHSRLHQPLSRSLEITPEIQEALNPPGLCNACETDDDCIGDLECHQTIHGPLSGCFVSESATSIGKSDATNKICGFPVAEMIGYILVSDEEENLNETNDIEIDDPPLGLCIANCDDDSQCDEDLVCYFREDVSNPIPGCIVKGDLGIEGNFCVQSIYKDTESYFNSLETLAMSNSTLSNTTVEVEDPGLPASTNYTQEDDDPMIEETVMPTVRVEETELPANTVAPADDTEEADPTVDSESLTITISPTPSPAPTESPTAKEVVPTLRPTIQLGSYDEVKWMDLPAEVQDALKVLGHDEESWNEGDEDTDVDALYWNLLSTEQQEAAKYLGHDQQSWDGEYAWSSLTVDQQAAAARLGYDEFSWNFDIPQDIDDYCWDEMNADQQADAAILGYDRDSWDAGEC